MIVFDLECRAGGHRFEGWFASSDDFVRQQQRGLVSCPQCGSGEVGKAPMAPRLARKGNQLPVASAPSPAARSTSVPSPAAPAPAASQPDAPPQMTAPSPLPPQAMAMMRAVAAMQAEALKSSRWVGENFAEDARAMHYGDKQHAPIHGQATPDEARDLVEEGIEIAPVLFPIAPPGEVN